MAASIAVEVETGSVTSTRIRHNGYFAGDFVRSARRTGHPHDGALHGGLAGRSRGQRPSGARRG